MRTIEEISRNVPEAHFIANQVYAAVYPTMNDCETRKGNAHQSAQQFALKLLEQVERFVLQGRVYKPTTEEIFQTEARELE